MPVKYILRDDGTPGAPPQDANVTFTVVVAGSQIDANIFVADAAYEVVAIREVHSVAGAGSSTLNIEKCTGTTAPGSGTDLATTAFALDSTANTVVSKTTASGLTTTQASKRLAVGDRLALDWSGTVTAYVGTITVSLRRIYTANDQVGF